MSLKISLSVTKGRVLGMEKTATNKNLKICSVCDNEIAKSAKVCPHCGAKNKKPIYKRASFWIPVIAIVFIVAFFVRPVPSRESLLEKATPIELQEILSLGNSSPAAAEEKFNGNCYIITGYVVDMGNSYISLNVTPDDYDWITVYLDKEELATIKKGDIITVVGRISNAGTFTDMNPAYLVD